MPFDRRPPRLVALAAALLSAALIAACTAQEPPTPVPGTPAPGEPTGGAGKVQKPATPGAPAAGGLAAKLLDDPQLVQKGKLGRTLAQTRCTMCHKVDGKGGVLSPPLEQVAAERFAKMEGYGEHIAALKAKDPARYNASKKTFDEIEADTNRQRRVLRWLEAYLAKPTFDNGQAKMLKQALTPEQVEQLLAYMLTLDTTPAGKPAGEPKPPASE